MKAYTQFGYKDEWGIQNDFRKLRNPLEISVVRKKLVFVNSWETT